MAREIGLDQDFETTIRNDLFYVDKTGFIKEWYKGMKRVTLITRPRRFGKTMTINMIERFFSIQYNGKPGIFENLAIGKDSDMMKLQGTYPVISLSLAGMTEPTYEEMIARLSTLTRILFGHVKFDLGLEGIPEDDALYIESICRKRLDEKGKILPIDEGMLKESLYLLSVILYRKYNKKPIILLDEYDAPLENAYLCGYWDKAAGFFEQFYKNTFKVNNYLERALITGINMISKESLSSPFNNPDPCSVLDSSYSDAFGFTQEEVDATLEEYGMTDQRSEVKRWYDGYQFGHAKDMYNPWSICFFIDKREFEAYWWGSASNKIVSHVVKNGSLGMKETFVDLLQGREAAVPTSREVTYDILLDTEDSVWGLLLSSGYLKALGRTDKGYVVSIVNQEVMRMMDALVASWFRNQRDSRSYDAFTKALLESDEKRMQDSLSRLSLELMGIFDTATKENDADPENFYHGFVLGLVAALRDRHVVTSNRESGEGRYDVMLEPKDASKDNGIILEFKVFNPEKEKDMEGTCQRALQQIEDKKYDVELKKHGIPDERIVKFGIAFKGKKVLVRKKKSVDEETNPAL